MARIESITGAVEVEVLAPSLNMNWDPITNQGSVMFNTAKYMVVDGVIRSDVPAAAAGMFHLDLTPLMNNSSYGTGLVDPETQTSLAGITPAGIMTYIKAFFAAEYDKSLTAPSTP